MVVIKDIDLPEKCGECLLFKAENRPYCELWWHVYKVIKCVDAPYGMPRPDWCLLNDSKLPSAQPELCEDTISRQAALDAVFNNAESPNKAYKAIRLLPPAQLEITRCKDCKHHHRDNSGAYYCGRKEYGYGWGLNDFCSDAERREE